MHWTLKFGPEMVFWHCSSGLHLVRRSLFCYKFPSLPISSPMGNDLYNPLLQLWNWRCHQKAQEGIVLPFLHHINRCSHLLFKLVRISDTEVRTYTWKSCVKDKHPWTTAWIVTALESLHWRAKMSLSCLFLKNLKSSLWNRSFLQTFLLSRNYIVQKSSKLLNPSENR